MPDVNVDLTTRCWLRLPALAVPVRVVFQDPGQLGPLESTLVKLLLIHSRSAGDLANVLGLGGEPDLVEAALFRLFINGKVRLGEQGELWVAVPGALDQPPTTCARGWVLLTPPDAIPAPTVWLDVRPPHVSRPGAEGHLVADDKDKDVISNLRDHAGAREVQKALNLLVLADRVRITRPVLSGGENTGPQVSESAQLRSLLWDYEPSAGRGHIPCGCWAAVDLLPRPSGSATAVYHEPDVYPGGLPDLPVSSHLESWLGTSLPGARGLVEQKAGEIAQKGSLVLSLAGINGQDELDSLVTEHMRQQMTQLGAAGLSPPTLLEVASDKIHTAQEWLVIWLRQSERVVETRSAYGNAVESLLTGIAGDVLPGLRTWERKYSKLSRDDKRRYRARYRDRSLLAKCLRRVGLEDRLGPSRSHLESTCRDITNLPWRLRRGRFGAGTKLTLWLLPCVLLQDPEAAALHGGRILRALEQEPRLFHLFDGLIQVRNDAAHVGEGAKVPPELRSIETVDDYLMRVWVALLSAYRLG